MSESWERPDEPLNELIQIENYKVITNVLQRTNRGGKPALIINQNKFHIKEICPTLITVPVGVEAVWALLKPKVKFHVKNINYIAVCSYYFSGQNPESKDLLYDHMAEAYNFLKSKYKNIHFLLIADSNRLDLKPITSLGHNLVQVVKVPTRLNPSATLDTIITSLSKYYEDPFTKPPIQSDLISGKPSDHLVVLFQPKQMLMEKQCCQFKNVEFRPLPDSGLAEFGEWLRTKNWSEMYLNNDINFKANFFQNTLLQQFFQIFPLKQMKISEDDEPWFNDNLKNIDRRRKREYFKNPKSKKSFLLNKKS